MLILAKRAFLATGLFAVVCTLHAATGAAEIPTADNNFTVVLLPDTQRYSEKHPENYSAQTSWKTIRELHLAAEGVQQGIATHGKHLYVQQTRQLLKYDFDGKLLKRGPPLQQHHGGIKDKGDTHKTECCSYSWVSPIRSIFGHDSQRELESVRFVENLDEKSNNLLHAAFGFCQIAWAAMISWQLGQPSPPQTASESCQQ